MQSDLDADSLPLLGLNHASAQRHDLVSLELASCSALRDFRRLAHEVREAVRTFEDEVRDLRHFIEGHGGKAALKLDSRANGRQALRGSGLHHGPPFVGKTPLEIAHELHLAQRGTVVLGEPPSALPGALGETELGQELEPAEHLEPHLAGKRGGRQRRIEGNSSAAIGALLKHPVQDPEVRGFDSPLARKPAIVLTPKPQRPRREFLAACTYAVGDVLAGNAELVPFAIAASDHDVEVGVTCVVMLDGHPLKRHSEVALEGRHEFLRVAPKVHALAFFGRDDELPKARIARALPAPKP
jgi:hypothetical protein